MDKQMRLDIDVQRVRRQLHEETQQARRRVKLVDDVDGDGFRQTMKDCFVVTIGGKATLTAEQMSADVVQVTAIEDTRLSPWVKCTTPPPCSGYWLVTSDLKLPGLMYRYMAEKGLYSATSGWPFPISFGEMHWWRGLAKDPTCST